LNQAVHQGLGIHRSRGCCRAFLGKGLLSNADECKGNKAEKKKASEAEHIRKILEAGGLG
jgi:hypothetical protein